MAALTQAQILEARMAIRRTQWLVARAEREGESSAVLADFTRDLAAANQRLVNAYGARRRHERRVATPMEEWSDYESSDEEGEDRAFPAKETRASAGQRQATGSKGAFGRNAILLDSQASLHVTGNADLLGPLYDVKPRTLGGVQQGAEGLLLTKAGQFGAITKCMHYHRDASATLLSFTCLVDDGIEPERMKEEDCWKITLKSGETMIFRRHVLRSGKMSKHYVHFMDGIEPDLAALTVKEAIAVSGLTPRQLAGALEARVLMRRLGNPGREAGAAALMLKAPQ